MAENADQLMAQAVQLHQRGKLSAAIALYRRAMAKRPGDPRIVYMLASAECSKGRMDVGRRLAEHQLKRTPDDVMLLILLGTIERQQEHFDAARPILERAMRLDPTQHRGWTALASIAMLENDYESAWEHLKNARPHAGYDVLFLAAFTAAAKGVGRTGEAVDLLREAEANGPKLPSSQRSVLLELARLLDSLGEYDAAMVEAKKGNAVFVPTRGRYKPAEVEAAFDRTIAGWTTARVEAAPSAGGTGRQILYIVGMPRSGTSMIEQVLACGEGVFGGGELETMRRCEEALAAAVTGKNADVGPPIVPRLESPEGVSPLMLSRARKEWDDKMASIGRGAELVTDKQPTNFLYMGSAHLLAPDAKVLFCRRNPLDTCVSNFFQDFHGHLAFADGLDSLGHYYRLHVRLMDHWRDVLPTEVMELHYERFVAEQEAMTRAVVEFAGRPWDDEHLRFHESKRITWTSSAEQVRRPLYSSSVKRWKRYEKHIGPLIDALGDLADTG